MKKIRAEKREEKRQKKKGHKVSGGRVRALARLIEDKAK